MGIVEADETYILEICEEYRRNLGHKARRHGCKAVKRGLSDEQVPVLVVSERGGATVSVVLPAVNADTLLEVIKSIVAGDIVLVNDGHRAYLSCATAIGVRHEALDRSIGERVRNAFHIQAVNSRHSQLKDFLRRHRGIAIKYLNSYLRWFQRLDLQSTSLPEYLANVAHHPCTRFRN